MLFSLVAALSWTAAASSQVAKLEDNLVYHSPAINHDSLRVDTDGIHERLRKRSLEDSYLPTLHWTRQNYTGAVNFTHNVASGDAESDSVILWTRIAPTGNRSTDYPIAVNYQVATTRDFATNATTGSVYTTADVDYTVKVLATGLRPWTTYYYRFTSGNATSPVGRAKTLPAANWTGAGDSINFGVFSCSNYPFGHFNAYGNAARKDDVDYMVHLGDYLYEYAPGEYDLGNTTVAIGRVDAPAHAIVSLADYRTRYSHYRSDPDLALNHQNYSWFATWDDHEVADNSYNSGSADSNDTVSGLIDGVGFTARKASAVRAYYEWMPTRPHLMSNNLRLYRNFSIGTLADLIILDTRQRDRDLTDLYYNTDFVTSIKDDDRRSMMGYEQEDWFYTQLRDSKARSAKWRVIAQQVVFSSLHYPSDSFPVNVDAWDGYTANRNRVLETLRQLNDTNNVVLAGDSHVNWVFDMYYPRSGSVNGTFNQTYGPYGMELAGTAVSSPSPFGRTLNRTQYEAVARRAVTNNANLVYADGHYRGYYELSLSPAQANATYFAAPDLTTRNSREIRGPQFVLRDGAGRVEAPYNGGNRTVAFGVLRNTTVAIP